MSAKDGRRHDVAFYALPFMLHRDFVDYPYFSDFGMLLNAGICSAAGIDVGVIDALAQPYMNPQEQGREHFWIGCRSDRIFQLTSEMRPKVAVICGHSFLNIHAKTQWLTILLDGILKSSPNCVMVYADCYIGGMHFIDTHHEKIFNNYPAIKHIVKYHADVRLPALLEDILSGREEALSVCAGTIDEVSFVNPAYPAWRNISIDNYLENIKKFFRVLNRTPVFNPEERTFPAVISRGCKYNCSFCSSNPDSGRAAYLRMNTEQISEMLKAYKNDLRAERVAFLDGLVNSSALEFDELLDALDDAQLRYDFLNGLRADKLTLEHIRKMRGKTTSLAVSAESADDETLKNIGKGLGNESIEQVAAWCAGEGVPLTIHYVVGFPGENIRSIQRTFEHAHSMKMKYGSFTTVQYATPFPGTKLYKESRRQGLLKDVNVVDYSPYFSNGGLIEHTDVTDDELRLAFKNWKKAGDSGKVEKVIINLTYLCNNKCVFCAIGDKKKEHSRLEDVMKAIAGYRKRGARLLDFDGGEPTLYPELAGVIKAARKAGFERVAVTTNGRKLSEDAFAMKLMESGITDLLISLYSASAEIHDALTGVKGSHAETVIGIKNAARLLHDNQTLSVNTTLGKTNYSDTPELARFVASLGVKVLNIQMLTPFGSAKKEHAPDVDEALPYLMKTMEMDGDGFKIQIVNMPPCSFPGHESSVAADTAKRERDMVFIGETGTNLAGYLSTKRTKTDQCNACVYMLVCDGKYQFT